MNLLTKLHLLHITLLGSGKHQFLFDKDVDGDSDIDLGFHFRLGDNALNCESTDGTLAGETFDGTVNPGTDRVYMVNYGG